MPEATIRRTNGSIMNRTGESIDKKKVKSYTDNSNEEDKCCNKHPCHPPVVRLLFEDIARLYENRFGHFSFLIETY